MSSWMLVLAQALCFWPVWRWYLLRLLDGSDEPWGIVALVTALVFSFAAAERRSRANEMTSPSAPALALTTLYIVSYWQLPPLARAVLAIGAMAFTVSRAVFGCRLHLGMTGLLVLSLPLIASLQFYLGYPLRVATGEIVATVTSLFGEGVTRSGTLLRWRGELVAVDAPCSGIKMLWTGMYLNFTLACAANLDMRRTWLAYAISGALIFLGNVGRTFVLFHSEAGIISNPPGFHTGVGLVVFAAVSGAIVIVHRRIGGTHANSRVPAFSRSVPRPVLLSGRR